MYGMLHGLSWVSTQRLTYREGRGRFGLALVGAICLLLAAPATGAAQSGATAGADAGRAAAVREDSIRIASGGIELRGMLRLPADPAAGPFPAVLLLPGGGTQYLTLEPDYWARRFAEAGIAALVVHKRGTGDSGGEWSTATFEDLIGDAGAAIEALRAHPEIAGRGAADGTTTSRSGDARIGVMGFSQGGRLAPLVAARFGADAAVGISGPQLTPAETRLYALENALRRGGMPEENLAVALPLWREYMDRVLAGEDLAPLDARIAAAAERMNPQALPPTSDTSTPSPIFNSLDFDGRPDLARLDAPFLAMYGADDPVVPVEASVAVLREVFAASGYDGFELVVIPGVGHGLSVDPRTRHPRYQSTPVEWMAEKLTGEQ